MFYFCHYDVVERSIFCCVLRALNSVVFVTRGSMETALYAVLYDTCGEISEKSEIINITTHIYD